MVYKILEICESDAYYKDHHKDWVGRYVIKTRSWRTDSPRGWYCGEVSFLDIKPDEHTFPHAGFRLVHLKKVSPSKLPKKLLLSVY